MSYVNVTIYDDADQRLRACLMEAERKFWCEEADRLRLQLENITAAVEKWGHVTISTRRSEISLIAKPTDNEAEHG
jgi:hypothetical protein